LQLGLERGDLLDELVHLRGSCLFLEASGREAEGLCGGDLARGLVFDAQGAVDVVTDVVGELFCRARGLLVVRAEVAVARP